MATAAQAQAALLASFVEKAGSSDKDLRYMAANDLRAELLKDSVRWDAQSETKICQARGSECDNKCTEGAALPRCA